MIPDCKVPRYLDTVQSNSYREQVKSFIRAIWAGLAVLSGLSQAFAAVSQTDTDLPRDTLYRGAKRYLLVTLGSKEVNPRSVIRLEDFEAGIIRFIYKGEGFSDPNALLELIELGKNRSRLRITLPSDFAGRAQILADKVIASGRSILDSKEGRPFNFPAENVFQSARRFILRDLLKDGQKKLDIIRFEDPEIGIIRFLYQTREFREPDAGVEVIPTTSGTSRLKVELPSLSPARRILFEDQLVSSIEKDLGQGATVREESPP